MERMGADVRLQLAELVTGSGAGQDGHVPVTTARPGGSVADFGEARDSELA
jgi:hypothetical protein